MSERAKVLQHLAQVDKNAARLAAYFESMNEESEQEARLMLLCLALQITREELTRCAEVLEQHGVMTSVWRH